MPPAKPEEEQPRGDGSAATHLLAFALGAVSVGAALLVRALQKKLRKRRRVVRSGRERPAPSSTSARPAACRKWSRTYSDPVVLSAGRADAITAPPPLPPAATARNRLRSAAACCPKQQLCHLPTATPPAGGRAASALPVVALPRQAAGAHPGQADDPAHLRAGVFFAVGPSLQCCTSREGGDAGCWLAGWPMLLHVAVACPVAKLGCFCCGWLTACCSHAPQACKAKTLDAVVVATDDERIAEACRAAGAQVVMTHPDCANGGRA